MEDFHEKPGRYDFAAIETKWQAYWEANQTFRTPDVRDSQVAKKPKFFILDMFPYPSGAGLHVGHPLGYCATDIYARYKRMRGFHVLHPMGFDAFGLPAEQYAVETNVHPSITTRKNIEMYRRQLRMFGFSYDWNREVSTSDPSYYKFTQWMFLRMYNSWFDDRVGQARPIAELLKELQEGSIAVPNSAPTSNSADAVQSTREWRSFTESQQRKIIDDHRMAYLADVEVNWCPALGTVLANEEVDNEGRSERGGHPVFRRPLRQWMFRITAYADRLLTDLANLDWPEPIKIMQRNWIGKSVGARIKFPLRGPWSSDGSRWPHRVIAEMPPGRFHDLPDAVEVYTTRPDTIFGATYLVLSPEHPLVQQCTSPDRQVEVLEYGKQARAKTSLERSAESKTKTGVFTGGFALNPADGSAIPIWIADYVLMEYGTGAIMAVPGSDQRDFQFAIDHDLPIRSVVKPTQVWLDDLAEKRGLHKPADAIAEDRFTQYIQSPRDWGAFVEPGIAVESPAKGVLGHAWGGGCDLNGLSSVDAKARVIEWLEASGIGRRWVQFRLRDWLFSRQRYWGEPFPVMHSPDGEVVAMSESELPLELPPMDDFKPTPSTDEHSLPAPPLSRAGEWVHVRRDGVNMRRDVNTMPNWAGSCWYYLRFIDPGNELRFCDPALERFWMPVDLYVGGAEHAVLHLLYARFWHKVLYDLGEVSTLEPFQKLFNQGKIQGFAYRDKRGSLLGPTAVMQRSEDDYVSKETGEPVTRVIAKMSKSLKNVVNPDEIIAECGADTFRLYEMYMGPLDADKPWNTRDVPGLLKLCQRIWRLIVDETTGLHSPALQDAPPDAASLRALHRLIGRVTSEIENFKFNTAIAAIFDFVNAMTPQTHRSRSVMESFVLVVAPFAPHLAEELWHRLGHAESLAYAAWPQYDEALGRDDQVEVAVQIAGKVKARFMIDADADDEQTRAAALANPAVQEAIGGKAVRKVIVVKGRLVNLVVG